MAKRLPLALAMLVFALMPSDGLAAGKAPPLRDTGVAVPGELFSDGERLIGVPDSTGMLVLDAITGRRGYVRSPAGCEPAGVGGGAVAFACPALGTAGGAGVVTDLLSGRQERLPNWPAPTFGYGEATVNGVGQRWVRLRVVGYHFAFERFVERATGRLVATMPRAQVVGDPDARSVWRPLCRPLRLRSWDGGESGVGDEPAPYGYRSPVGATISQPDPSSHMSIIVERCGRRRPLLVRPCIDLRCTPPMIAAGVVAWREAAETRSRVRAFLPRSRRLLIWPDAGERFVVTAHRVWVVKDGRLLTARV